MDHFYGHKSRFLMENFSKHNSFHRNISFFGNWFSSDVQQHYGRQNQNSLPVLIHPLESVKAPPHDQMLPPKNNNNA